MDQERTLLQQIREKEQEFSGKIEAVKKETEAAVAGAENDAENLLCTADSAGKIGAEQLYWQEKGKIGAEIERLKTEAEAAQERAVAAGEKNLPRAVEAITRFVTME
jgi:vacuolar-type H+-ATPase subunit H